MSERRACDLVMVTRKTFRRVPLTDRDRALRQRLCELAEQRRRFGSPRLHALLRREGWAVNRKRVYRLYRQEGLSLRHKRPRRHVSAARRMERAAPSRPTSSGRWTSYRTRCSTVAGSGR